MYRILLLFWLFPLLLWGIEIRTNIQDVSHEGPSEQIGSFSLIIREGELPFATFDNPIYVRFRIVRAHGWSKTLVDQRVGSASQAWDPINLAIRSEEGDTLNPALPRNAIQLVRLIKGEKEGWIRINRSIDFWDDSAPSGPSPSRSISVSVGISGTNSIRLDSSTPTNGNEYHLAETLASTILCANYKDTPGFNVGDIDTLDFISFDGTTEGVEEGYSITNGANTGLTFSDDTDVARGSRYITCFELMTSVEQDDAPPHEITFSKLSAIDLAHGCEPIPPIYLKNCSDYEWHPGSQFFICPISYGLSGNQFYWRSDGEPDVIMGEEQMQLTTNGGSQWVAEPVYTEDVLAGYRLTLMGGTFEPEETIELNNLRICLDNNITEALLKLHTWADVIHPIATEGELVRFTSFASTVAHMVFEDLPLYKRILPYTGYDHPEWQFHLQTLNLADEPSRVTSYLRNRHGLLLRIEGEVTVPAKGTHALSIAERFGEEADQVLAWVDQYSDKPFQTVGILSDPAKETFELIEAREQSHKTLIAPHITMANDWNTTAYILATGTESPRFFFNSPGQNSQHIDAIQYPGATAVYSDIDFASGQSKIAWFEVEAELSSANGQVFYFREQDGGQLASLPLSLGLESRWVFDHLGRSQNGWWNGTVINNPHSISNQCTLSVFDDQGELIDSVELELAAEERKAFLLKDIFTDFDQTEPSRLEVLSDQSVVSFLLMGMESKDQLTDVPGNMNMGEQLVLPYMRVDDAHWTGLVVQNPNESAAEFYFEVYAADGSNRQSTWIYLPGGAKSVFEPEVYLKNLEGFNHLVVFATRPIRGFALLGNRNQTELASLPLHPIP